LAAKSRRLTLRKLEIPAFHQCLPLRPYWCQPLPSSSVTSQVRIAISPTHIPVHTLKLAADFNNPHLLIVLYELPVSLMVQLLQNSTFPWWNSGGGAPPPPPYSWAGAFRAQGRLDPACSFRGTPWPPALRVHMLCTLLLPGRIWRHLTLSNLQKTSSIGEKHITQRDLNS